jgi:hypothetical protein
MPVTQQIGLVTVVDEVTGGPSRFEVRRGEVLLASFGSFAAARSYLEHVARADNPAGD